MSAKKIVSTVVNMLTPSKVDEYWNKHTVNSRLFKTPEESVWYLAWRNEQYPEFYKLSLAEVEEGFEDQIVMDYGCGPGNDLVNFLVYGKAKKIIGVDVSKTALKLAEHRLSLHKAQGYDTSKVELLRISDKDVKLPIGDATLDYINCQGVLMHVSEPEKVLREFWRVLKPGGRVKVMVYNSDSLWRHAYVGYQKMVLGQPISHVCTTSEFNQQNETLGMNIDQVFQICTDGKECPRASSYTNDEFTALASGAGFLATFKDAYFSKLELKIYKETGESMTSLSMFDKINQESKAFLSEITPGHDGYPKYRGKNTGIGGVYDLAKPN